MEYPWLDTAEYPFPAKYFAIHGRQMHYVDEGQGDTILMVHGTPSWSFDFRHLIKKLSPEYRCIAVDHLGFGLSDKPEHYDYSTQNHSKTLERFVLDKQLQDITLVVHDFGGVIGLNLAIQHPHRIKRLVILNSWLWSSRYDPDFIKLSKVLKSPLLPLLYRYLNFSAKYILPRSFGDQKLSPLLIKQYTKPFANRTQRNGALAFAQSLLHDQDWFEQLWENRKAISDKPTLFIWGMKDPVIKPHYLEKFQSGFTNAQTVKLLSCGHFPQEEQPETVANAILEFLNN